MRGFSLKQHGSVCVRRPAEMITISCCLLVVCDLNEEKLFFFFKKATL